MNQLTIELTKEIENLNSMIDYSKKIIANAPSGKIRVSQSGNSQQFYYREKEDERLNGRYLKKEERELGRQIIEREYHEKLLKVCLERKDEILKIVKKLNRLQPEEVFYSMPKGKRDNVNPVYISDGDYIKQWISHKYQGKDFPEDYPEIYSDKGERVRSKTEKIIADKLYKEKIPYKYEQPYELKKYGIVYPDFRILDVPRRQEIILEHFGMMDDEIYAGKALKKIRLYQKNGLVLGKELLITFETTDAPFDSRTFENMLVAYGLM